MTRRVLGDAWEADPSTWARAVVAAAEPLRRASALSLRVAPASARTVRQRLAAEVAASAVDVVEDPTVDEEGCIRRLQLRPRGRPALDDARFLPWTARPRGAGVSEAPLLDAVRSVHPFRVTGRVDLVRGLLLEATLPGARVGEVAMIRHARAQVLAEVVGFAGSRVQLLPLGSAAGLGEGAEVASRGETLTVGVGHGLVGRVLDGLGRPMDGGPPPPGLEPWTVDRPCPDPFRRARVEVPLPLGIRAIDGLCTVGRGQRLGLFAGAGGKSPSSARWSGRPGPR